MTTIIRSSDAGASKMPGSAGAWITTLDFALPQIGFSKVFSGTNLAVYRADSVLSTRRFLRVDDTTTRGSLVTMYEDMSDVNTGTNGASSYWHKNYYVDSTAPSNWVLIGDERAFYVFVNSRVTYWEGGLFFGDIVSCKSDDNYHCALIGNATIDTLPSTVIDRLGVSSTDYSYICRPYTQVGAARSFARYSHGTCGSYMGFGSVGSYPNPADVKLMLAEVDVYEDNVRRGRLPGFYCPLHAHTNFPTPNTIISNVQALAGADVLIAHIGVRASGDYSFYRAAVSLGAWR